MALESDQRVTDCIYCRAALTPETRRAHVWPAGLGGRLKSREVCCNDCNQAIGLLEDKLRASVARMFASVGATNDEGDPFRFTIEMGGYRFELCEGNAVLKVPPPRFDAERKSIVVPLPAALDKQATAMAKAFWDQYVGPDEVQEKLTLEPGDPGPELPVGPTGDDYDVKVGTNEHKRVFVKMALELLAYHRHDLVMRGELSEARRFARHGTGTFSSKPDTKSDGSGLLAGVAHPEIFNAIEVWSFRRSAYFRVVLLGPLAFTGTLTTEWAGEPFRAVYAFDARKPTSVVESRIDASDGPNIAIWFDGMKEESVETAFAAIEELSLRVARSAPRLEREPKPDLEALGRLVREKLAAMKPKRKRNR